MFKKTIFPLLFALLVMIVLLAAIPLSARAKAPASSNFMGAFQETLEPTLTATPTWVPACRITGGITTTDWFSRQNSTNYDCLYGCSSSPYLRQANSYFLAGTYYWSVEIVNGPHAGELINNGSFFLPNDTTFVGLRANQPAGDVVIPLGWHAYNLGAIEMKQVVKVTMWQEMNGQVCAAKTDNFKVWPGLPAPTITMSPTITEMPTLTETSTATITPTPTTTPTFSCTDC